MITTNIGADVPGGCRNFFVTASDPAGPWSEPVWLDQGGIDPSLFFEDDKVYMTSNPDDAITLCEIDPLSGKRLNESRIIWSGTGGRYPEAPHLYKKDGWYYLMIAEGGTELGHSVTIARSRDIYGPYEGAPHNPILSNFRRISQRCEIQGVGHADLVEAPDGSWWMVALGYRTMGNNCHILGRETMLAPVEWHDDGWPVINGNGTIDIDMTTENLPATAEVTVPPDSLDFTTVRHLDYRWVNLRNPLMKNYSLDSRGLCLLGESGSLDTADAPTWVGIRQTQHSFTAGATLSMSRQSPCGSEAGMTVYMDRGSHYDIYIRSLGEMQIVECRLRLKLLTHNFEPIEITNGQEVKFRIDGGPDMYTFHVSIDGGNEFVEAGHANARYLSTETAGGFTGMMIGLYASGKDSEALFTDFQYAAEQ